MKICVSFEGRVRSDSTGFYFLRAFKALGHEVEHIYPSDMGRVKPGDFDLYFKCDDGLRSDWNDQLHPSIYQVIDTHIESDWRVELANKGKFDLVCVAQKEGLKLPWESKNVLWVPLACDIETHSVGPKEKKYDVAVIMNFHSQYASERIDYVHDLLAAVPNFFFGNRTPEQMAEKFAESRIVFNKRLNKDLNMRDFEALCSGSVLLADRQGDMAEIGLIDGVHYVGYSGKDEMKEKAKWILENPEKAEHIAYNGQLEVMASHTYRHRAEKMLQEIK